MPMLTPHCLRSATFGFLAACLMTGLYSCGGERTYDVPASAYDHDVPEAVNVRSLMQQAAADGLESWQAQTGEFGLAYTEDILRIGAGDDPATLLEFERFLSHPDVAPIEAAIDTTSGLPERLAQHEATLRRAFQRFHHWFPDDELPQVAWMNSGFNYAVYPMPGYLGVGLEWFLGTEHPIVQTLAPNMFPQYMRNRMQPDRVPTSAFRGWLLVHFSQPWYRTERCVDEMLFWGKAMFILEQCMPDAPKAALFDWSEAEWQWAREHERDVWIELQPQDVLFESDRTRFGKWFTEGPFTRYGAIPQDSPDRLGVYMGWRMVSDYMDKHPELELADLIQVTDINPVIKAYRPE